MNSGPDVVMRGHLDTLARFRPMNLANLPLPGAWTVPATSLSSSGRQRST